MGYTFMSQNKQSQKYLIGRSYKNDGIWLAAWFGDRNTKVLYNPTMQGKMLKIQLLVENSIGHFPSLYGVKSSRLAAINGTWSENNTPLN